MADRSLRLQPGVTHSPMANHSHFVRRAVAIPLLLGLAWIAPAASACKCAGGQSVDKAREQASLVVVGRVVSAEWHSDPDEARRRREAGDRSYGPWYGHEIVI